MKSSCECLACLSRNAVNIASRLFADKVLRRQHIQQAMQQLVDCDLSKTPVHYLLGMMDLMCQENADAYYKEKIQSSQLAEKLLEELKKQAIFDPESFESRLRLAIAGNILDFGIFGNLDIDRALDTVRRAFTAQLDLQKIRRLQQRMESARTIFYALDNCGEAVFDREFMRPYRHKTILGVRGKPVLNDVTATDLEISGLNDFAARVVDNGRRVAGTILELAPPEFCDAFASADLVIAKGQGNFETLDDTDQCTAFLFMAKCPVVTQLLQVEPNSLQIVLKNFPAE
ncbi:MAG: DUF89 family protein [Lentisphaerae bacterium]|nr:DUF89 family protein [Lentisphaerota bacterium]